MNNYFKSLLFLFSFVPISVHAESRTVTTTTTTTYGSDGNIVTVTETKETSDVAPADKAKLKLTPIGTLLFDGGVFVSPQKDLFPDGVALPDVRMGIAASYGKWSAKLEAGLAYGKVLLKDMWLQYSFSEKDFLRGGLFLQHFGYQNSTAACMKVTMIEPISNTVFNDTHMIGLTWFHSDDKFFTTLSAHVEPKASTLIVGPDEMTREGYGVRTRLVARPLHREGLMVQAGVSGAFETPRYNGSASAHDTHDAFTFGANMPTKITQRQAISATVDHARNLWKMTPELMLCYGGVALESQYYFLRVNRKDNLTRFNAYGAYATVRGLLLGGDYTYNMALAGIATPRPKSLELVGTFNYTCLSDRNAAIFGGRVNDAAVGLNYYINKYMIAKLRYSYTHVWNRAEVPSMKLSGIQARMQFIF